MHNRIFFRRGVLNKEIFKQPNFYIALVNFLLGFFYLFQEGTPWKVASFIWFLSFICNFHLANRAVKEK